MSQTSSNTRLLYQLADSSFPSGGFAHSGGLEALYQWGELKQPGQLLDLLVTQIRQSRHYSLPQFVAAHQQIQTTVELDNLCHALLGNHVARRASLRQGQAFLATCCQAFDCDTVELLRAQVRNKTIRGHLLPTFGYVTRSLGISLHDGAELFLFTMIRDLISSAIRLNIIGPLAAQSIWPQLDNEFTQVLKHCEAYCLSDIAQTSPILDILQSNHDRLYSRLFQS
ncbi:MAG: urease accessory protein UreF [Planctomycetaceae bacterium]|nr:urease accessory protein UreF [Planctomycetaceae bacterium]MBT4724361.1 urease accessory protein UreF [Planctomycetaceae bacterium]MBT4846876.1 urease accessory protein UreF [Planctomycetaceae bacterium]MBT5123806.1 urease accessory protein UreF [Planctomycetaceae bacterium]MBT5597902.1 urease accessory protein UreF [Planctomycetaceae bacterium]